ncbi:MAG: hypothetical protein HOO06_11595 [Bdellovibrionaceae bacterium]|jgi:hypothetical protein|nr:hypothetical protein [Pseudobdellovibrionaceae bacterium]
MKRYDFLILIIILLTSLITQATALPSGEIQHDIKILDGSVAFCFDKNDAYENRSGVYSGTTPMLEVDDNILILTIKIKFSQCTNDLGDYQFSQKSPYKQFYYNYQLPGSGVINKTQITPKFVSLRIGKDGQYADYFEKALGLQPKQILRLKIPMEYVLNKQSFQNYKAGKDIISELDYWIHRIIHFKNLDTQFEQTDIKPYGIRRIRFAIKNINDVQEIFVKYDQAQR